MRDRQYRNARLALGGVQQVFRAQRLALHPGLEAGRRQQVIESHRQRETILLREERVEAHDTDRRERRVLYRGDQSRDVQLPAILPGVIEQAGYQYVFPARDRVGVDAQQRQDAGGRRLHPLAVQVDVVHQRGLGGRERLEHRNRQP